MKVNVANNISKYIHDSFISSSDRWVWLRQAILQKLIRKVVKILFKVFIRHEWTTKEARILKGQDPEKKEKYKGK